MAITSTAAWLNTVFSSFDTSIAVFIHGLFNIAGWFFTPFFELISFFGKGGICLILLSLVLLYCKRTRNFGTAMLLGLAIGALLTNVFLKVVIARPRPYVDESSVFYQIWLLVGQHVESDKSFPSGHTTSAFAAMVPIFIISNKRKSWLALAFAFLMGISRIYLAVHFPSDVLGGIIVGTVAGCIGTLISYRISRKWYEMDFPGMKSKRRNKQQDKE